MEVNENLCPLCGKPNNCAFRNGLLHEDCWCNHIEVPKELREQIPEHLKGKACICKECVLKFIENNK